MTNYQKELIERHNAEMAIINHTALKTGLSPALLYYCARFGMIGMPWCFPVKRKKKQLS